MTKEALFSVAINQLPSIIGLLKGAFAHAHPDQPPPTDADIITAWKNALRSTIGKDDAFIDAHRNP